ncbi:uncharacterized protein PV06_02937 [Exophiala oligosperma]|uniref:Potassium channel domain-containing protein n=1 Tax=Exophiala oligosperma TaxID=215243 RepID=A0A0D2AXF8_9EURO|nr:uncharacterized protein PV06_02937 [Exophiala oligosperma]KIW44471.1 hypothetical protein PV06_02937 [Exophiala oligosperma]
MNDPGLDEPIDNADSQVRENVASPKETPGEDDMDEEEEERNFLMPARWWYASTGFPLIAGTFGPMANAFSICALVENWRVKIPPGGTEEHGIDIKDPKWLIAVNAVSLVCALIANMSLLLNMARRVPFQIAQPITIIGFWVASILLIALVAVASHHFHAAGVKHQALTQAYYYAIFAAGLYQIISYLMCVTVYGAYKGYYSREFKLTVAQRTLMLQTISFLTYLLLGALVYSHIEGWKFLDAVYWADFTTLTIGVGDDYTPKTHLGRGLLFPFAMGGIIILGLVVGSIRSLILERGKKKMAARITEKTRARLVREIDKATRKRIDLKRHITMGLGKETAEALTVKPGDDRMDEQDRRAAEFEAMRKVQDRAMTERKYMSLGVSSFAFAFLWCIGALVFFQAEQNQQWTYFESLYFSYTTLLTIGYGDFEPISNSGKPFFVFWSLLAVPTLTILISDMGDTVVKAIKDATIWLGEVTVLPSDESSMKDRLMHGIYRSTLGKVGSPHFDVENKAGEESGFQELHPGLAKLFRIGGGERPDNTRDGANRDELARDFEQSERIDESEAHKEGKFGEENEHHLRHVLISQIRRVYADTTSSTPKRYSYDEWVYFLKLLGEDERDSTTHKHASELEDPTFHHDKNPASKKLLDQTGQDSAYGKGSDKGQGQGQKKFQWSWIGNRSPLMGDKEEAEWLLEKLFERLEESLRKALKEEDNGAKKGNERYDPSEKQHDRCEEDDSGSEETITRCKESSRSQEEQEKTNPAPFDITR